MGTANAASHAEPKKDRESRADAHPNSEDLELFAARVLAAQLVGCVVMPFHEPIRMTNDQWPINNDQLP